MAGPAKPKAPSAAKPDAPPEKVQSSRKRPTKTLTLEEATEQLTSLNFSGLTEVDRLAAVLEIRARLVEQAHNEESPAQALARRILLLRLWHELVQLRVIDVKNNVKPSFEKLDADRLFPPITPDGNEFEERHAPQDHTAALNEALKPLEPKPFVPPVAAEEMHLVRVKLLQAEMVRGMKLPAGIIVDVQPEDADSLVATGVAVHA